MIKDNELATVTMEEISLAELDVYNSGQAQVLLRKTPKQYVKERPAKGGGKWEYVTGGYVKKVLNLVFSFNWDFEILDEQILHGEAIVKGRLTCRSNGHTVVKTQYGNKEIVYRKNTEKPLSIGNDLKAAATDALKKCAAELGVANDIYNKEDFREVNVVPTESLLEDLKELYGLKEESCTAEERTNIERIIENQETESYSKAIKTLKSK